jgi:hypothetical protein
MPHNAGFYIAAGLVVLVIVILLLRPLFRKSSNAAVSSNTSWRTTAPTVSAPAAEATEEPPASDEPEEEVEDDSESLAQLTADADKLLADREYGEAVDAYDAAIEKAREELGPDDLRLAELLVKRGTADRGSNGESYDEESVPDEYQEALAITERHHGPMSEHVLPILRELIAFYDHVGLHDKANSLLFRHRDIESAVAAKNAQSGDSTPASA